MEKINRLPSSPQAELDEASKLLKEAQPGTVLAAKAALKRFIALDTHDVPRVPRLAPPGQCPHCDARRADVAEWNDEQIDLLFGGDIVVDDKLNDEQIALLKILMAEIPSATIPQKP